MSYYTKITTTGLAAIAAAMNSNSKVPIAYMAFGDGNGSIPEPDENALTLVNEVYRTSLNKVEVHSQNPNWLVCEAIIPSAVGGFNIREVALYDNTGKMLAVANYPPTYKPTVEEGAAKIQTIRIVLQVDNTGNFELVIDPDVVLATVQYVNENLNAAKIKTSSGRTQEEKNKEIKSMKDFNAAGDGIASDDTSVEALLTDLSIGNAKTFTLFQDKEYKHSKTIIKNGSASTLLRSDKPSVALISDGTDEKPNTVDDDPALLVSKVTSASFGTDTYRHSTGGVHAVVRQIGNYKTGTEKTCGAWMGVVGASKMEQHNIGTVTAQEWDIDGSAIGVAGMASSDKIIASGKIVCGVWSEVATPDVTDEEMENSAGGSTVVGMEININMRHKDTGYMGNKGTCHGLWMNHYPYANTVSKNWTTGLRMTSGVVRDTDGADYTKRMGYHNGIYMEGIKGNGIEFGNYNDYTKALGIKFPQTNSGRFRTAIHLGANKMNMGNYVSSDFDEGDIWHNGGIIYYRTNGENRALFHKNLTLANSGIRKAGSELTYNLGTSVLPFNNSFVTQRNYTATVFDRADYGSPEGFLTAGISSTYRRLDGGAGSSFYVKESGTGNTGWVAK